MSETSDELTTEVAELRERVKTLETQQERTQSLIEQFQTGAISRRTFLAAVGGAVGVGALASNVRAAPSYGNATGQIGTASEPLSSVTSKDIQAKTVKTEQADISNETFVRLTRNNQTSSTSSTTLVNGFDSVARDVRGETSNGQFIPDNDGDYLIAAYPEFAGSATPGDKCAWRLQNVTDSSPVRHDKLQFQLGSPNRPQSGLVAVFPLTAGETYEIQLTDQTNSFSVDIRSEAVIKSVL